MVSKRLIGIAGFCMLTLAVWAQSGLQSGPMVGYVTLREAAVWVQTNREASVAIKYWLEEDPKKTFTTPAQKALESQAYALQFTISELKHSSRYQYRVVIDGKEVTRPYPQIFKTQTQWRYQEVPTPTFKMAFGSCSFINELPYDRKGNSYGGEYGIYTALAEKKPDLMLWLGDNVYMRDDEWETRSGYLHRYTHTRSLPEMQPLLASTANYAARDDHDYGSNDADRSFPLKQTAQEVFDLFWANPTEGGVNGIPGAITTFTWGDVHFFLLDNRYHRTPNNRKMENPTQWGEEQFQWLIDLLSYSKATFKVVISGGQILNDAPVYENMITNHAAERQRLLDELAKNRISGVVFLTGDRHHTELSKLERPGQYPLYEYTSSPLNSGTNPGSENEPNRLRVKGTWTAVRNFGTIDVQGPAEDRKLLLGCYDSSGKQLWTYTIAAKDITLPDAPKY